MTPALLRLLKAYKPIATVGVVSFLIVSKSSLINTLKRAKELQSVQLQRSLRIVDSPGVIFEDDDSIQGQKVSLVFLCNVVKPEDVDDPISVGGCASSPSPLRDLISGLSRVEEILARDAKGKIDEDL